jgi:hypothetical protein
MKRFSILASLLLAAGTLHAETPVFPKSELRPGLRGVTRTVMQGTNIVELETEVLGLAENYLGAGMDLIIAKLVDDKTRVTGAVHGMSGSPLYINGRMVGALSRRIAMMEKDGHCGYTPIEDMLYVRGQMDRPVRPRTVANPWRPAASLNSAWAATRPAACAPWLGIPVDVGSMNARLFSAVQTLWSGSRLMLAQGAGGGGSRQSQPGGDLQPGAAVAAAMAVGDLTFGGTGTLTWREGERVLAFGHPMDGLGDVAVPMCEAEIITTIGSYERPFKMANMRRMVGTVVQDRLSAIAGVVGKTPELGAYRIAVKWDDRPERVFEGRFHNHESSTPAVLATLLLKAVAQTDDLGEDATVQYHGALGIPGEPALKFDVFSSGTAEDLIDSVRGLAGRFARVYGQDFKEVQADRFEATVTVRSERNIAQLIDLRVSPQRAEAGGRVTARAVMRPRHGADFERVFTLALPDTLRSGDAVTVEVANAREFSVRDSGERADAPMFSFFVTGGPSGESARADSLTQLIERLNQLRPANQVECRASIPRPGVQMGSTRLDSLPASAAAQLQRAPTPVTAIDRSIIATDGAAAGMEVNGSISRTITIQ